MKINDKYKLLVRDGLHMACLENGEIICRQIKTTVTQGYGEERTAVTTVEAYINFGGYGLQFDGKKIWQGDFELKGFKSFIIRPLEDPQKVDFIVEVEICATEEKPTYQAGYM